MAWQNWARSATRTGMSALMMLAVACVDDKKPGDGDGPPQDQPDGGADRMDAMTMVPTMDGNMPVTPRPDGSVDAASDASSEPTGDATVVPQPDAATTDQPDAAIPPAMPPELKPLPADGNRLSICYDDADCKSDDLVCYMPRGVIPGTCVDDCNQDSDCPAAAGVPSVCNDFTNECEFDCAGSDGEGKGACPPDMVCADVGSGGVFAPEVWRCRYPAGGGKRTAPLYERCDPEHDNGDCAGTNVCHQPALNASSAFAPNGYCTTSCEEDTECPLPSGAVANPVCGWTGACEFDCAVAGEKCPGTGMSCRDIDNLPLTETLRCIYLD
jgi:hypothetical protein